MRVIHLPKAARSLVFDIDLTLYDSRAYYDSQAQLLIERLAAHFGIQVAEAEGRVEAVREDFARENGGRSLSMGNAFRTLGVSIATSVRWREELFRPEDYLKPDDQLDAALDELARPFSIAAVTNNPKSIGEGTLSALGVRQHFCPVVGLDTCGESKPTMKPFRIVAEEHGVRLTQMISIGDRVAVDIELPVQNGMGGILVECMDDIYRLPSVLSVATEG